jgi:hypothetical protein
MVRHGNDSKRRTHRIVKITCKPNEIRREPARIAEDFKRCQIVGIDKSFVDELKKFQWEKDE